MYYDKNINLAALAFQEFCEDGLSDCHPLQKIWDQYFFETEHTDPICDLVIAAIYYGIQINNMDVKDTIEYKEQNPYTDPELRERIKNKLLNGNKGGRPGQWSARKSQLLAVEYKAQGGKYHGPKTNKAKSLDQWSKEKWQTSNGKPALRPDGKMSRYLPKAEWDKLTEAQKQATNQKKLEGNSQYVFNTAASKQSK